MISNKNKWISEKTKWQKIISNTMPLKKKSKIK